MEKASFVLLDFLAASCTQVRPNSVFLPTTIAAYLVSWIRIVRRDKFVKKVFVVERVVESTGICVVIRPLVPRT